MGFSEGAGDVMGGASSGAAFGPYGAAAGAGLGLGKYFLIDKPKYERQLALTSATQRYSPWTGLHSTAPDQPDPMSNALAFGSTGASIGQGMSNNQAQEAMQQAYLKNLQAQTDYFSRSPGLNFGTSAAPPAAGMSPAGGTQSGGMSPSQALMQQGALPKDMESYYGMRRY